MQNLHQIEINTRDRLLRGWENSMQLVKEFKTCESLIDDCDDAKRIFSKFAEDEGRHAAEFKAVLLDYELRHKK